MALQVLILFLNEKSEEILKMRSLLQSIIPLPQVQETSKQALVTIDTEPITSNIEQFQPKFGSSEVYKNEFKHSAAIISNMIHAGHLYIQLVDKDFPLYHQLQEDLQVEFLTASNITPSYCATLTAGNNS